MPVVRVPPEDEWRRIVEDPEERRVFEALADPRYDLRTVRGLSKSSKLAEDRVREILAKYPRLVRQSPVLDAEGRELYGLTSRGMSLREWLGATRAFLSKTTTSSG